MFPFRPNSVTLTPISSYYTLMITILRERAKSILRKRFTNNKQAERAGLVDFCYNHREKKQRRRKSYHLELPIAHCKRQRNLSDFFGFELHCVILFV